MSSLYPRSFWSVGVLAGAVAVSVAPTSSVSASAPARPPVIKKKVAGKPIRFKAPKKSSKGSGSSHEGGSSNVPGMTSDPVPSKAQCKPGYTICDFIHPKITMAAQYSLAHLYAQGGEDCALALNILGAAERGGIVGVHKQDEGKPALLAQRNNTTWWNLVPNGEGAIVAEFEKPPMVVFEKRMADKPIALAYEIAEAWNGSSLRNKSFTPPPPKRHSCAAPVPKIDDEPPEIIEPPQCQCFPEFPPEMNVCGQSPTGRDLRCLPVPGQECGVCEGENPREKACLDKNDKRHKNERKACKNEYSPEKVAKFVKECAEKAAKDCVGSKDVLACIESANCALNPKPLEDFHDCLNRETDRYQQEAKRCRSLP